MKIQIVITLEPHDQNHRDQAQTVTFEASKAAAVNRASHPLSTEALFANDALNKIAKDARSWIKGRM